jgi:hypothetical protein
MLTLGCHKTYTTSTTSDESNLEVSIGLQEIGSEVCKLTLPLTSKTSLRRKLLFDWDILEGDVENCFWIC